MFWNQHNLWGRNSILTQIPINNQEDAAQTAQRLLDRGVKQVIVKMGSSGAYVLDQDGGQFYESFSVTAVDTVAAGDAFNGGLAAALAEERPFKWGVGLVAA